MLVTDICERVAVSELVVNVWVLMSCSLEDRCRMFVMMVKIVSVGVNVGKFGMSMGESVR